MANESQCEEESVASYRKNLFVNLECWRNRQHAPSAMVGSHHTKYVEHNHPKPKNRASPEQDMLPLQREVDRLRRKLRRKEHDRRSLSSPPSEDSRESWDQSYRRRFKTLPSETFSASSYGDRLEKSNNKM
nr:hypothetical protein CFP56_31166 [Quercus suber]